jgi:hypothetical protein
MHAVIRGSRDHDQLPDDVEVLDAEELEDSSPVTEAFERTTLELSRSKIVKGKFQLIFCVMFLCVIHVFPLAHSSPIARMMLFFL